jgi:transposase
MAQKSIHPTRPAMIVHSVSRTEEQWVIEAESRSLPRCPSCGAVSGRQHSWYQRSLRDLPIQGAPVAIRLRVRKWRCEAPTCARSIFAEQLPGLASPHAHQSDAIADILAVMGHSAGGETSRRLLARLGIVVGGDTVLRHLKRRAQRKRRGRKLRVVGVGEWAWRRGATCETILVYLETRTVADVLPDRSAASLGTWLSQHPVVEIVCRDRHGLYAEGARVGAPQARQVADRFGLM